MADSVSLLRRKIQDVSLAVQDGTMNSVITLATIEVSSPSSLCDSQRKTCSKLVTDAQNRQFGKGNIEVSRTHVEGVKRLVNLRGGINSVRQTSPLTARMISW
jgi:hypothetical protein